MYIVNQLDYIKIGAVKNRIITVLSLAIINIFFLVVNEKVVIKIFAM